MVFYGLMIKELIIDMTFLAESKKIFGGNV